MCRKIAFVFVLILFVAFSSFAQNTYDDHLSQAKSLISLQKYVDAVGEAQKAIAADGQRWEAYAVAAKAYSGQKLYDDAIGMLQLALVRAPDDKKPLIRDAIADCRKEQNQGITPNSSGATRASNTAPTTAPSAPTQAEIVLWKSIENSSQTNDFQAYLTQYPNGTFVALATSRIDRLKQQEEAAAKVSEEHNQALAREVILHVYRRHKQSASALTPTLFMDGKSITDVSDRTQLSMRLSSGKHEFHADGPIKTVTFDPGKEIWMRIIVDGNMFSGFGFELQVVPVDEARSEIQGLPETNLGDLSEK
jgi:tetratricopeptide (TPR) repeat protein